MNTDDEDDGLGFGEEGTEAKTRLRYINHVRSLKLALNKVGCKCSDLMIFRQPVVAFFHVVFRTAAIIVYILCGLFGAGFITSFVTVVVLLALDFWTVKNITGRKMVGLRWTNFVDDSGHSYWIFEGRKGIRAGGRPPERRIFWSGLIISPVVWLLLFFSTFFTLRFQWSVSTSSTI